MPGDGEGAIGLDQKPEGTGKPDRSASAPRHRAGVAGWDSTPCMSGVGKNNASGADRAGSIWIVGKPEVVQVEPVNNDKSACQQRLSVTAGAFLGTNPDLTLLPNSCCGKLEVPLGACCRLRADVQKEHGSFNVQEDKPVVESLSFSKSKQNLG